MSLSTVCPAQLTPDEMLRTDTDKLTDRLALWLAAGNFAASYEDRIINIIASRTGVTPDEVWERTSALAAALHKAGLS